MPKFFVPRENITDDYITIIGGDYQHITKVLRKTIGDSICICDGRGINYNTKIKEISNNEIILDILDSKKADTEADIEVTIFQGLPKASKMDYIIQKTTELGAVSVVPVKMSRCVMKIDGKDEVKKVDRWQKIASEAAKQSGRGIIPVVEKPVTFDEAISMMKKCDLKFAPYECESDTSLKEVLTSCRNVKTVSFMIGPEGGFDFDEIDKLKKNSIATVTLGKRILRTETAGEAVLSMVMYEIGDINKK